MKRMIPLAVSVCLCYTAQSQNSATLVGSRANGLGYASACLNDEWSIFNNVAGLSTVEKTTAGFTYEAISEFKAFNRMAAVIAVPIKFGVAGLGIFRTGDNLYNEQILSGAFSNQFGIASLGIKVNYVQYNAEGFGRKGVVSISLGGIAELTPQLSIGAHIININQPEISFEEEKLPTILLAGIAIKASDKLFITTELEKDLAYKALWKTGLEYEVNKKFIFRTGFNVNPTAGYAGLGFRPRKFLLDYAYTYTPDLGPKHQASVGYRLARKPK